MDSQAGLVQQLVEEEWLTDQRCIEVMKRVDRAHYVHPSTLQEWIYEVWCRTSRHHSWSLNWLSVADVADASVSRDTSEQSLPCKHQKITPKIFRPARAL
jgi:hypothetical protein